VSASVGLRPPLRFVLTFAACFLLGTGLLMTPWVRPLDTRFSCALVAAAHWLISLGGGKALVQGDVLRHPVNGFAIEMLDGCNAVSVMLLLWSAILAFPAAWRHKVKGLLAGTLLIQAINLVRFISLYYLGQYSMTWFQFAHGYLWESLLVLDTMIVFGLWVRLTPRQAVESHAG
jgi:exosortase H (IPTLxxWG-CTERM-specific)